MTGYPIADPFWLWQFSTESQEALIHSQVVVCAWIDNNRYLNSILGAAGIGWLISDNNGKRRHTCIIETVKLYL